MPTREFADLVSMIAETLEHVLPSDPLMPSDPNQTRDAATYAGGPAHAYVLDGEKIVWHYPDAPSRLIEDSL
jgi:hypothetical protein